MVIRELTDRECRELLKPGMIARLGCARENQPYVVPIHIYFDENEYIYGFATLGRKIAWMRENPRVCVQVDDIAGGRWATVIVFGTFEELLHIPSQEAARRRALELFRRRPEWWEPAAVTPSPGQFRMPVIYRIRVETMTGRVAERVEPDDNGEPWWLPLMSEPSDRPR